MAKEESGRLLSKVAKFVRNPLKDWSELDAQEDAGGVESGYSREMLKEIIERRQRNDFVRRREFETLRKLRQREAASAREGSASPSSLGMGASGKSQGRALTLKKIDEIEEQMSQQWWKGRPSESGGAADTAAGASPATGMPSQGDAPATVPGMGADSGSLPSASELPSMDTPVRAPRLHETALEEASIRFAHGDDAGAELILLQSLAPDSPMAEDEGTWRALLDLYRATGDAEKFVATSTRYAQRLKRPGPDWISLRALAQSIRPSEPAGGGQGLADWYAPARLSRASLLELTRALQACGSPVWRLDWRALQGLESDTVAPLRALFAHWAEGPVQLRFAGADRLLAVLAAATPLSQRDTAPIWWQLHMTVLRTLGLVDEFELVALNYCITYEISPPPWQDPKGQYQPLDTGRAAPLAVAPAGAVAPGSAALVGDLRGEAPSTWQRLDADMAEAGSGATVSCAALVRIDFTASGTLLNWVMAREARGERVEFVDVHRLISAFFGVVGIADHATVLVRRN